MKRLRKVIKIDEEKCTGCGACIPNCPEGALQIIDGKARLISDLFCDGLGACVGACPEGALVVEERPAEPYDEERVLANIVKAGPNTIAAHLEHLKEHGATEYYEQALAYLKKHGIPVPKRGHETACSCPGAGVRRLSPPPSQQPLGPATAQPISQLRNWPIQITLIPVSAPYLKGADLLIAADCVAAAHPGFHEQLLRDRILLIGCPKLDDAQFYQAKLTELFKTAQPKSIVVAHMTVPCCFGLVQIVKQALIASGQSIPYTELVIDLDGSCQQSNSG